MDKWFVYQWSEIIHGEKIPFYVGVGKIRKHIGKYRYRRAYETHQYSTNKKTIAQLKLDKLKRLELEYSVDILFEDLELHEALRIEFALVKLYGRKNIGTGTLLNLVDGGTPIPMKNPGSLEKLKRTMSTEEYKQKKREEYFRIAEKDPEIISRRRMSLIKRHADPEFKQLYIDMKRVPEYLEKQKNSHPGNSVLVNGIEYSSIHEASRVTGYDRKTISQKTKKGLEVSKNYRKSTPVEYRGIQYESLREMAKSTGISRHKIKNMILCGDVSKSNGLH